MHSLSICRTCPRDLPGSGAPGLALGARLAAGAERRAVQLLRVNCLGACRSPCSIAVDASGKARLRFSGLREGDSGAIEAMLESYCASADGRPKGLVMPLALRVLLTAVSPAYPPAADVGATIA